MRMENFSLSDNADEVKLDAEKLVVVHSISLPEGKFGTPHVEALFCNCLDVDAHGSFAEIAPLRVSAHALIARDGSLTQFVPFTKRAWHAGESCYRGRDAGGGCRPGLPSGRASEPPE